MNSLEIAELTGKMHRDVTRDIENILNQAEIDVRRFEQTYTDKSKIQVENFSSCSNLLSKISKISKIRWKIFPAVLVYWDDSDLSHGHFCPRIPKP